MTITSPFPPPIRLRLFGRNARTVEEPAADRIDPPDIEPVDALPKQPWAFVWYAVKRDFRLHAPAMVLLAGLAQAIDALVPYALSRVIDSLTAAGTGAGDATPTWLWFGVIIAIWFSAGMLCRLYEIIDIALGPRMRALAQKRLFGYLMGHSPRYFHDNFAGKLGQKIKNAGNCCINLVNMLCFDVVRILVLLTIGSVLLALQHPSYVVVTLVWTVLYLSVSAIIARRCIRLSKAFSEEVSTSSGKLIDAITNAEVVRAFARVTFERRFLGRYIDREMMASRRFRWFLVLMRLYQAVSMQLLLGVLIGMAILDTRAGTMPVGAFAMVFTLSGLIASSVHGLSNQMLGFFEQIGTLAEALELVAQPHEIRDRPHAQPLVVREGAIDIETLCFAHADGTVVFSNLNLAVAPGEKIGLVGRSGAGKSTLVKLLRRQYEPQRGSIRIDGRNIADVTWDSLNEAIAEVPQSAGIFHRPIRDNIRYARPDAPDGDVIGAAIQAHCHDFIVKRPTGYDTMVGEQGIKLSGGERQRVAIARALVKDARVLVLDEATSSLDSESEHLIQEALWRLMKGRTVIAVAHRLSTITGMDRILYLDGGTIVEQGSHPELLARGGAYARLWQRQMGGFLGTG